jgi:uncharacterized membrane protein
MRAFAVFMMVQGHTIDALLAPQYRNDIYPLYASWNFMRGLTAPIFMFSAGVVFTYLFHLNKKPFAENPRVKKGIKRFFLLVFIGYMLRYPTASFVYFGNVTPEQWATFFTVDVLHLIGFSLLFIIGLSYISDKFKINDRILFPVVAGSIFLLYPVFAQIPWPDFLPVFLANYFYHGSGSFFPLVPWTGFVIAGGALGSYLAEHNGAYKSKEFMLKLAGIGVIFIMIAALGDMLETAIYGESFFWTTSPNLLIFRLGLVLMLNAFVAYLAIRISKIPELFVQAGRYSLTIYVVHLVLLFGSAWSIGITYFIGSALNPWLAVLGALVMLGIMGGMVYLLMNNKNKFKELPATIIEFLKLRKQDEKI